MQTFTAVPAFLSAHPALLAVAVLIAAGAWATAWRVLLSGPAAAAPVDDADDRARGLRILADDRARGTAAWMHAPAWAIEAGYPSPAMRTSAERAAGAAPVEVGKDWVDPMRADYTAYGIGSVVSLAAIAEDTKLRGPVALAILHRAEEQAYAEAEQREFAAFDAAVADGLARIDRLQANWGWSFYAHDDAGAHCPACRDAVEEVSGEYRDLVARVLAEPTGPLATVGA